MACDSRFAFSRVNTGPYFVVSKALKYFTVDLSKRIDVLTVDRLKAAHLLDHLEPQNEFDDDGFVTLTPGLSSWGQVQNSNLNNHFPVADDAQARKAHETRTKSGRLIKNPSRFAQFITL